MPSPYERHRPCRRVASSRTVEELGDETRLPDAGRAEQREQVRGPLGDRPIERAGEHVELLVTSDHRRVEMPLVPGRFRPNADQTEGGHTAGLPLELERRALGPAGLWHRSAGGDVPVPKPGQSGGGEYHGDGDERDEWRGGDVRGGGLGDVAERREVQEPVVELEGGADCEEHEVGGEYAPGGGGEAG